MDQPQVDDQGATASNVAVVVTLNEDWLKDFYKECGREVTLAYTTLNQMKNWALVVQAAIVAAIGSFARSSYGGGNIPQTLALPVLVGSVLAYVFTLRFFVRAILCYINLQRWNTLQADIINYKLLPRERVGRPVPSSTELAATLTKHIQEFYFRWRSPLTRTAQIASNLKLGFGILMVLPVFLLLWSFSLQWDDAFVQALVAFAAGATIIEAKDFFTSSFFDMPNVERKHARDVFPTAGSGDLPYISQWIVLLFVCVVIGLRPWLMILLTSDGSFPALSPP